MFFAKAFSNLKWTGVNLLKNTFFRFTNGAVSKGQSIPALEDWQYCKSIRQQLKNNNIKQALALIFQSYFNDKVLDIQIYNSVYQKINELSLELSYSEILYEIYREHFPPNALLNNWMSKLTASTNTSLLQKLKKDYESINLPYPVKIIRNSKKQAKRQQRNIESPQSKEEQLKRKGRSKKAQLNQIIQQTNGLMPKIQLKTVDDVKALENINEDYLKMKFASQIKQILQNIGLGIGANSYSKVSIHDVEITMNVPADSNQSDDEVDYYDEDGEQDGMIGWDISKIKIGRIEFYNDKKGKDDQ